MYCKLRQPLRLGYQYHPTFLLAIKVHSSFYKFKACMYCLICSLSILPFAHYSLCCSLYTRSSFTFSLYLQLPLVVQPRRLGSCIITSSYSLSCSLSCLSYLLSSFFSSPSCSLSCMLIARHYLSSLFYSL